jgi:phage shock protein E
MEKICSVFFIAFMLVSCGHGGVDNEKFVIDENSQVIDVRTEQEYKEGHLKNAINIPYVEIKNKINEYVKNKDQKITLYCRSGRRSGIAEKTLKEMGYTNAINAGAYEKLKKMESEKQKE